MALTVDYSTAAPWLITVPKADLTLLSGTKYQLTVDDYWRLLTDYSDNSSVMAKPVLYSRIAATSSTPSITQIDLDYYRIQFEDGLYSVNIVSGNTNIREAEVKNQVSVNTNNTTGFIDPTFLQFSTFEGAVHVNQASLYTGTLYPIGTPSTPVNNMSDALTIAQVKGLEKIHIGGALFTISASDVLNGLILEGDSAVRTTVILTSAASITNCIFRSLTLTGSLDGGSSASNCIIGDLSYLDGSLLDCLLAGTITLGGAQANLLRCASAIAGSSTPTIDMAGAGANLAVRDYNGGIKLYNHTAGSDAVSIDMASGQVIVDSTVSSGTIIIRGIADVTDNSTGTAVVQDDTVNRAIADGSVLTTDVSTELSLVRKLETNKLETNPATGKYTLYDDDSTTVLLEADIYEDAGGTIPYKGDGIERRNKFA